MEQEKWVAQSLTAWGIVFTTVTGLLPAINALLGIKGWSITPDWLASLNQGMIAFIQAAGMLFGVIMVVVDQITGGAKKTLTFAVPENVKKAIFGEPDKPKRTPKKSKLVSPGVVTVERGRKKKPKTKKK